MNEINQPRSFESLDGVPADDSLILAAQGNTIPGDPGAARPSKLYDYLRSYADDDLYIIDLREPVAVVIASDAIDRTPVAAMSQNQDQGRASKRQQALRSRGTPAEAVEYAKASQQTPVSARSMSVDVSIDKLLFGTPPADNHDDIDALNKFFEEHPLVPKQRAQAITKDQEVKLWEGLPTELTPLQQRPSIVKSQPTLRDRWHRFIQARREARYYHEPRMNMRRALGAIATVSLLVGGGLIMKQSAPEGSAQREAIPAVALNVHETPQTTTSTTRDETSTPQFTTEEAKAIITISAGRYAVELEHPELGKSASDQAKIDQIFMPRVEFAAMVQGASSTQG